MPKSKKNVCLFGNSISYTFTREDLTCNICKNKYDETGFSNIKIKKLAIELKKYKGVGPRPKIICRKCTQQPRTHLTCFNCGIKKPLVEYSKTQRGSNGIARCLDCMKQCFQDSQTPSGSETSDISGPDISNYSNSLIPPQENTSSNIDYPIISNNSTTINSPLPFIYNINEPLSQEIKYSSKFNSIPPCNFDTYSVFQLIGRKNPLPPSQEYIFLNFSEIQEKQDSIHIESEHNPNTVPDSSLQFFNLPNTLDRVKCYSITSYDIASKMPMASISIHDITIDHISLLDKYDFCADYEE
ncbi:hypothetical protein CONCODRAFT_168287 [Conidiobolus coronatus NRRL 28638]|uniref:Stc1 domain-containing protein n=1 Tax=Conidiobolus coronatus (strain ATCC 28846 / CBS 209.66 / NRRL 28638) TaxID=796925 RepID=A0A137NUY5_CONC2|nr:hypothetical protein CONCODRAFT_168287 [Conidiobolus coronatus NRRL 28638]|eukprot:KXN66567.1 hypothetical protein CONCODRAFT_168287 [Conidiobolus coronatus NRRL 28638]